jgi:glutamate-ammonia-ligase adenylyltransferase
MGFGGLSAFEKALRAHTSEVRRIFHKMLKSESGGAGPSFPREFKESEAEWKPVLEARGFRDPAAALERLREFVEGPGYVHVSSRTAELAHELLPRFLALGSPMKPDAGVKCEDAPFRLSDPDRVLTRLDSFIAAYGARSVLFELWNSNPAIFELLVKLFDRSEFLAELAIRTPDLVDELVTSGRLRQRKTTEETLRDLRHGLDDADQFQWLRRYHEVEVMRIGLRDILGLADPEQYRVELSALADACLQYALEVVVRRHRLRASPFAIIGMGKLGGIEIDYGSDLDIVFVTNRTSGSLRTLQQIAVSLMELLSRRTESGIVFHTDARLRPDGEKGLLVNTLAAYEEYYRERAQLWEIQSLTRARPVAGDLRAGAAFQELAARLANFRPENIEQRFGLARIRRASGKRKKEPATGLAAYVPDWKRAIYQMRLRIERERTPAGKDDLAIKTGTGGLMDAEFVAQALCLEHGWQQANTVRALERGCASGVLPRGVELLQNYLQLRRLEGILRRWSYEGETVLPDDPAPFYRVAIRCGFASSDEFRSALKQWRTAVRAVYGAYFGA